MPAEHEELEELTTRECGWCGEPFVPSRSDQVYCTNSHRVMAHRRRKQEAEAHARLVTANGGEFTPGWADADDVSLDDLHQRTTKFATHSYDAPSGARLVAAPEWPRSSRRMEDHGYSEYPDVEDDEADIEYADDDDSASAAGWNDEFVLDQKLDKLEREAKAKAQPWLDLLARNPGRHFPEYVKLQAEYQREFYRIIAEHENARGKEKAERTRLQRLTEAEQETRGRAALIDFSHDMGRGRRGDYASQLQAGRSVHDVFRW